MKESIKFATIAICAVLVTSCVTFEAVKNGHWCSPTRYEKQVNEMMRIMECNDELIVIGFGVHGEREYEGTLQEVYEETCVGEGQKWSDLWSRCSDMDAILKAKG